MNTKTLTLGALVLCASASQAVFLDKFDGNTPVGLATQTFNTGAQTDFIYWDQAGDMGESYFSVVNKASDIHSQFVSNLDADNNVNGNYAVYNGFNIPDSEKLAYGGTFFGLTAGQQYTFGAYFLTLAPNPPYAQNSFIRIQANGNDTLVTLIPTANPVWSYYDVTFTSLGSGNDVLKIWSQNTVSDAGNDFGIDNVSIEAVPEPMTMTVLGLGALAAFRRKRAK